MALITIDGKEYDTETLSKEAQEQLVSLRYVDNELAKLQAHAAALQTARNAYGRALKKTLEEGEPPKEDDVSIEGLGDNIEFDES